MALSSIPASDAARRTIATVPTYESAEKTVDYLSDRNFPVAHVTIVGTGLRYVEQVTKRVTTGGAAWIGVGQGAMLGLLWGALFGLFFTVDTGSYLGVLAYGIVVGALFGALIGAGIHASTGGRRDFASSSQTRADRYEIQVDDGYTAVAEEILSKAPAL
jgi:hypothetical protein